LSMMLNIFSCICTLGFWYDLLSYNLKQRLHTTFQLPQLTFLLLIKTQHSVLRAITYTPWRDHLLLPFPRRVLLIVSTLLPNCRTLIPEIQLSESIVKFHSLTLTGVWLKTDETQITGV
jgi:hypothetical protein